MERIIAAILAGTVAVSLGGAALADQHETGRTGPRGQDMGDRMGERMSDRMGPQIDFDAVDADKDGKITPAEIAANRDARFTAADTNSDGKLDRAELAARAQQMLADRMAARALDMLDADRNGALSADEMADGPGLGSRMFTMMDADKDGALTRAELDMMRAKTSERGMRYDDREGDDRKHH